MVYNWLELSSKEFGVYTIQVFMDLDQRLNKFEVIKKGMPVILPSKQEFGGYINDEELPSILRALNNSDFLDVFLNKIKNTQSFTKLDWTLRGLNYVPLNECIRSV